MTLIIILIALLLDRTLKRKAQLYSMWSTGRYAEWLIEKQLVSPKTDMISITLAIFFPVLMAYLLADWLPGLLQFLLECFIVMAALRQANAANQYRNYREAWVRKDNEACYLTAQKLLPTVPANNPVAINRTIGRELAWVNFQFYTSVVIWFTVFGAAGVVLYAVVRDWTILAGNAKKLPSKQLNIWYEWLNYVPARITSAGYLFIGDFTRALPTWLKYLTNISVSAKQVITHVATQATADNATSEEFHSAPASYVELAKRTMKMTVVVVAFLTIIGITD
ncbi:regulatory signaling modulator protein AmpE [Alteromonas sp. ASW11-130]|uniref:regulatory signaling modulator protein AmpE n=1 Tax=Alteromonas sp. ASW11-130 TaxID=3015775 RepID=UPI002241A17B|nr:regulatory signaling modulator protein AmpE [Alteromonas sp. ASW11-130]MCW8091607.1 regulatory signaling modulator protein AmpE [Alteromonas sp. ASW11-130]